MAENLVEVKDLRKYFRTPKGMLHAVDGVSFKIEAGKTLGVVGESGCGKSTLGRVLIHLDESSDGTILFEGQDVTNLKKHRLHKFRENAQMIFQDPYSSLNPRYTVEDIITPLQPYAGQGESYRADELCGNCPALENVLSPRAGRRAQTESRNCPGPGL